MFCFFFFQAEDGIRDVAVTGVQTCALPISSEAELGAVVGEAVNPEAHSHVVEEDVTRLEDGFVQAHDAVRALPVYPALELPAVKSSVARAKGREAFRRILVLQHGCGGHNL